MKPKVRKLTVLWQEAPNVRDCFDHGGQFMTGEPWASSEFFAIVRGFDWLCGLDGLYKRRGVIDVPMRGGDIYGVKFGVYME